MRPLFGRVYVCCMGCQHGGVGIVVRDAAQEDAGVIARIYVDSWNDGFGDIMGKRAMDQQLVTRWSQDIVRGPQRWWVAVDGHDVVGFAGIGPSRDPVQAGLGELDTIAVAPSAWRRGVGRALMSVAVGALEQEFEEAILWTVSGYERGQCFYEATGWRRDGGIRDGGHQASFRRSLSK